MATKQRCRLCGEALVLIHDFGEQPVAGYLDRTLEEALAAPKQRNGLSLCGACGLLQQGLDEARELLVSRVYAQYQPTYSMSPLVRQYLSKFLDAATAGLHLDQTGYVLEIGCNDGAVLAELGRRGYRAVGVDPSANEHAAAQAGYEVHRLFFGKRSAEKILEACGPATLIVSRHTLEHVFEPLDFLRGIAALLKSGGRAVIEVPYLQHQLMNNQFQSMTFQHVTFFTARTLRLAALSVGMALEKVVFSEMDAGSIVVFLRRDREDTLHSADTRAVEALESIRELHTPAGLRPYFDGINPQRDTLARLLGDLKGRCAAFGAGSKGQALLNMLEIRRELVPFVVDDTPGAAGKFIPGVGTEVVRLDDPRLVDLRVIIITAPSHVAEVQARAWTRFADLPILATTPTLRFVSPLITERV